MRGSRYRSRSSPSDAVHASVLLLLCLLQLSSSTMAADSPDPRAIAFLQDVVKKIAAGEKWGPDGVRVSELDVGKVKVGRSQRYEFHVRAARKVWAFRLFDDATAWRKVRKGSGGAVLDLLSGIGTLGRKRGVKMLELEGPLELLGVGDYDLSLRLPFNTTHVGLKRVIIDEGIKIKLEGAEEVTFILPSNAGLLDRTSMMAKEDIYPFLSQPYSECPPLPIICIQGMAFVTAHRIHDLRDYIETEFYSPDVLELLSENHHNGNLNYRFHPVSSIHPLGSRLVLVEKILGNFIDSKLVAQDGPPQLVKAKIAPCTIVKLNLELEKEIRLDDGTWKKKAGWKTRPSVERVWFEVVASVEDGKALKPLRFKRMKKPFFTIDTTAWSYLMSNISFTKFSTVLVPHEPLTLDVKW